MIEFQKITEAEGLASIRAIADEIWPETFAPILSPEQIWKTANGVLLCDYMSAGNSFQREDRLTVWSKES